jgi:Zinc finger, ZZ type
MSDSSLSRSFYTINNARYFEIGVGDYDLSCLDKETQCEFPRDLSLLANFIKEQIKIVEDKYRTALGLINEGRCSQCNCSPILGNKYKCIKCEEFFLCEECEKDSHEHPMFKYKPSQNKELLSSKMITEGHESSN